MAVAGGLLLSVTFPIDNLLLPALEDRFQRSDDATIATATGVIALGGGDERIREAGRIARRYPHLTVAISGAGAPDHVRRLLGADIDARRIQMETRSQTTSENARFTSDLLNPAPGERWLLVTSATHMPRAIGTFRKSGMTVMAWPIRDTPADRQSRVAIAQHEWLGLIGYRLLGRCSALFPAST